MVERVRALEDSYADLVTKCVERRTRLEDSRQLWQFYWDMAEEDNWIKEMENILSQVCRHYRKIILFHYGMDFEKKRLREQEFLLRTVIKIS